LNTRFSYNPSTIRTF